MKKKEDIMGSLFNPLDYWEANYRWMGIQGSISRYLLNRRIGK